MGKQHQRAQVAMMHLPPTVRSIVDASGRGALTPDEADVWKRVLSYRITKLLKPTTIHETHPGKGTSTAIYRKASPHTVITSAYHAPERPAELIDIDPWGNPHEALDFCAAAIKHCNILMVTSGEVMLVARRMTTRLRYPTKYGGASGIVPWVKEEFIPRLELTTGMSTAFFYVYPTTVRVILSKHQLPDKLWRDCPRYMSWVARYSYTLSWETIE